MTLAVVVLIGVRLGAGFERQQEQDVDATILVDAPTMIDVER